MKFQNLFVLATLLGIASVRAQEPPLSTAHDGAWIATLVCEDYRSDKGTLAKGYTVTIPMVIAGGRVVGERSRDYASSGDLQYTGEVREGGTLLIRAAGATGKPEYTPNRAAPGTNFGYTLKGELGASTGTAVRQELRPCKATFHRSR